MILLVYEYRNCEYIKQEPTLNWNLYKIYLLL